MALHPVRLVARTVAALAAAAVLAASTGPAAAQPDPEAPAVPLAADPTTSATAGDPVTLAAPDPPATVTTDLLPTPQIDGVVWDMAIVGRHVYVGGSFTTARPFGAAPGTGQVPRANLLRFDVVTGLLDTTWAPRTNAQVLAVEASPDGSRLYVGGDFTTVDGHAHSRLAAFDTATGSLVRAFDPVVDARVSAIAASRSTVWVGGLLSHVDGRPRARMAALDSREGALLPWAPTVDDERVFALALSPDERVLVVGGGFTSVNGSREEVRGLARLDTRTGQALPLPANAAVWANGPRGAIYALEGDGEHVYGVGYAQGVASGSVEGVFAVEWDSGRLAWVADCHGDSYDVLPQGDVVYAVSHMYFCGNIRSWPRTTSPTYQRATAMTRWPTQSVQREHLGYHSFEGRPGPTVLPWFPEVDAGTFTGQTQGAWSITGDGTYVVLGGEFPRVGGAAQQGLARFAPRGVAPARRGPEVSGATWEVSARAIAAGTVRVSWRRNVDRDDEDLTYTVIRDGDTTRPVWSGTLPSQPWDRPWSGALDTGRTPGATHSYVVRARDGDGNVVSSAPVSVVVGGVGDLGAYGRAVLADGASHYWPLDDAATGRARDVAATDDLTAGAAVLPGHPGAIADHAGTSVRSVGTAESRLLAARRQQNRYDLTVEAWFRAPPTSTGGHLVGFGSGDTPGAASPVGLRDRAVYLDSVGRVSVVLDVGQMRTVTSPSTYRDDRWHHVAATVGPEGMRLHVDGVLVAARTDTTTGRNVVGRWRIGDAVTGFPGAAATDAFTGWVDDVAVYPHPLSHQVIAQHHALGRLGRAAGAAPVASFTTTADGRALALDGAGSADPDGSVVAWSWDLGDGTVRTGESVAHVYDRDGTYPVTLTVTDDSGRTGTTTRHVTVAGGPGVVSQTPVRVTPADLDVPPGVVRCVQVTGRYGVPRGATGVVLNVTTVRPTGRGFVVVYPDTAGDGTTPVPEGSTVNFERGADVANSAFVALPPSGRVCYATQGATRVGILLDVGGYVLPGAGIELRAPQRVVDSRDGTGTPAGPVPPRSVRTVDVRTAAGLPADATGVLVNVTVTEVGGLGNLRVFPAGRPVPGTSVVNYAPGVEKANSTVVSLPSTGHISFWSDSGADVHVVMDVVGHTGPATALRAHGPVRLLDTRPAPLRVGTLAGPLASRWVHSVPVAGRAGVPEDATAVLLNVTAVGPTTTGNLRVYPDTDGTGRTPPPDASAVNYVVGRDVPNLVLVQLPRDGRVNLWSDQPGTVHVVADVVGYVAGG